MHAMSADYIFVCRFVPFREMKDIDSTSYMQRHNRDILTRMQRCLPNVKYLGAWKSYQHLKYFVQSSYLFSQFLPPLSASLHPLVRYHATTTTSRSLHYLRCLHLSPISFLILLYCQLIQSVNTYYYYFFFIICHIQFLVVYDVCVYFFNLLLLLQYIILIYYYFYKNLQEIFYERLLFKCSFAENIALQQPPKSVRMPSLGMA